VIGHVNASTQLSQQVGVALTFLLSGMSLFALWGLLLHPLFAVLFLLLDATGGITDLGARRAYSTAAITSSVTAHIYHMDVRYPVGVSTCSC
jgi:hypothetical protein